MDKIKYSFELNENGTVKSAEWQNAIGDGDVYFCTNREGDGIFRVCLSRNSRTQLSGTCDFSVSGMKPASARAKIRRWHKV